MFWLLVFTFAFVYVVQTFLGLRQAKHFAATFTMLRRRGRVAIGKRQAWFTAGAIVMFLLDDEGLIVEGRRMSGVTVLARFRSLPDFNGQALASIIPETSRAAGNAGLRAAVANARENYLIITSGGSRPRASTPFARIRDRVRADSTVAPRSRPEPHSNARKESPWNT